MPTNRDAQTLLMGFRNKYPKYKEVDDTTLLSAIQKKYPEYNDISLSSIPHSENLIQRAIKNSRPSFGSEAGKVAFQTAQGVVGNLPQNIAENFMTTALSGIPGVQMKAGSQTITGLKSMAFGGKSIKPETTEFSEKYLEPKTFEGQVLGNVGNFLSGSLIPGFGAVKGTGKVLSRFSTKPMTKEIKTLEAMKSGQQIIKEGAKNSLGRFGRISEYLSGRRVRQAEKLSYEASQEIPSAVESKFDKANKIFGEGFSKLKSEMTDETMADVIKDAAKDIGAETIPGSPGHTINSQAAKYGPKIKEGEINLQPRVYTPEEVQAISKEILGSVGDSRSKAIFNEHLINSLPDNVPGLKELKLAHKPIYEMAKKSRLLKRGKIKGIATGKVLEDEAGSLAEAEKMVGTNYVSKAKGIKEKNRIEQLALKKRMESRSKRINTADKDMELLDEKIKTLKEKSDSVREMRRNVGVGAAVVGGLTTAGGIFSGLRKLISNQK